MCNLECYIYQPYCRCRRLPEYRYTSVLFCFLSSEHLCANVIYKNNISDKPRGKPTRVLVYTRPEDISIYLSICMPVVVFKSGGPINCIWLQLPEAMYNLRDSYFWLS